MATFDASASTQGFSMTSLTAVDWASEDASTSTLYSFLTDDGHDIELNGTGFTYSGGPTGGTVTSGQIDLDNDNFANPDISFSGFSASLVDMTNGGGNGNTADFYGGILSGDDDVTGSAFNDTLKGLGGADSILGGNGNDSLIGDAGDDTLDGESGQDTLVGGSGNDYLLDGLGTDSISGGDDDDTVVVNSAISADEFDGGAGVDFIDWSNSGENGATFDLAAGTAFDGFNTENMTNFESLKGTGGADSIVGSTADNTLYGQGGNDTISGDSGADTIFGDDFFGNETGDDTLYGGDGDDILYGGKGADKLFGGADNDNLSGYVGNDTLAGQIGNDTLGGGGGDDKVFGNGGDDKVNGGSGNDTLTASAGDDTLNGGSDNDEMFGNAGADKLIGDVGNDKLVGLDGNDSLYAGQGDDTLKGGQGDDSMSGGAGADLFVFETATGADVVSGYSSAQGDQIELKGIVGFDEFADVQAAASQVAADVVINLGGGDSVTLLGVNLGDLQASDFIFS